MNENHMNINNLVQEPLSNEKKGTRDVFTKDILKDMLKFMFKPGSTYKLVDDSIVGDEHFLVKLPVYAGVTLLFEIPRLAIYGGTAYKTIDALSKLF